MTLIKALSCSFPDQNGFCMILEKGAKKRPLWADYGHYMGLNLGLFLRMKAIKGFKI
jgi:hypothetical protein